MHLLTPPYVLGPEYAITDSCVLTLSAFLVAKASMNKFAALISAFQPFFLKLPLPSRSITTSSLALHGMTPIFLSSLGMKHRLMAHFLNCKRSFDHAPGHLPSPVAFFETHF